MRRQHKSQWYPKDSRKRQTPDKFSYEIALLSFHHKQINFANFTYLSILYFTPCSKKKYTEAADRLRGCRRI